MWENAFTGPVACKQLADFRHRRCLRSCSRSGSGFGLQWRGTEYDIEKAIQWYERSAASGDVNSQYILGRLHESGLEIENDRIAAFKWYSIAEPKSLAAKSKKGYLTEVMTPAQIAEAESLAREWLEAHPQ
jgi:TPR repeat protein